MEELEAFMPHGMCYLWRPDVLALHVGSDALIALAYFSIPAALLSFLRRRHDLAFPFVFKLFIGFILACGITHAFSIVVVWEPLYIVQGILKLVTAIISIATAIVLWPLIPRALAIPSPTMLEERNARIEALNEELAGRIESLSTLAGGVAHDFNNMLTVITGHADLMVGGEKEPSRAQHLRAIQAAADRASSLCQQMLAYSGRGHFVMQRGDLEAYIDVETVAAGAEVAVALELHGDLPQIQLAPQQIHQLVGELARNAIEAAADVDAGRRRVRISTSVLELDEAMLAAARFPHEVEPGPAVVLEVEDTGEGMDDDTLVRLFDPYFSTRFFGRGLGMAAVQGIARGHGAAVFVSSTPGEGTRVRIAFPIPQVEDADYRPLARSDAPRRVLILDDEPGLLGIAREYCEKLGMEVVTTDDPDEAVEVLLTEGRRIDAVILDYLMPLRTGDEVLAEIREFSAVDIYLMSGFSRGEVDDADLKAELAGFLPKPFSFDDFRRLFDPDVRDTRSPDD